MLVRRIGVYPRVSGMPEGMSISTFSITAIQYFFTFAPPPVCINTVCGNQARTNHHHILAKMGKDGAEGCKSLARNLTSAGQELHSMNCSIPQPWSTGPGCHIRLTTMVSRSIPVLLLEFPSFRPRPPNWLSNTRRLWNRRLSCAVRAQIGWQATITVGSLKKIGTGGVFVPINGERLIIGL